MKRTLAALLLLLPLLPNSTADAQPKSGAVKDRLKEISKQIAADYPRMDALYKHFHQHPELSLHEEQTAARLAQELKDASFEVTEKVGGTGVVAVLKNGKGPTILVRADMDALPIAERTGLSYASKVRTRGPTGEEVGVMHACGHDVNMTCLTGTARVLAGMKDQWHGTLVFIGQPGEEIGAGARLMVKDGLFKRFPRPDYCLALHCDARYAHGQVNYRDGQMQANVDSVDVTVRGKGGHGAAPHTTIDPIVLAARIVLDLQTIVSRERNPLDPVVVTVGSIHGGSKHNIIPDEVKLQLTVRTTNDRTRKQVLDSIERLVKAAAQGAGAPEPTISVDPEQFTPSLSNDAALTRKLVPVLRQTVRAERVSERAMSLGGEDFSVLVREGIPGFYFFLGSAAPEAVAEAQREGGKPLSTTHSATYYPVPEPTIKTGVLTMSMAVLHLLDAEEPPEKKQSVNSLGMKLVRIEPGEFVMGNGDAAPKSRAEWNERDGDEAPAHKVKITKAFSLGATEVTNVQYELFDREHGKKRGLNGASTADKDPVTNVTWQQAVDFCKWLSKKEGQPYRLPTEAEWEYACRAGTTTRYSTGDKITPEQANLGVTPDGKPQKTVNVGSYKPNAWGLHDMHGNVAEWCLDWYGPYEAGDQSDPVGRADGYARVVRGWSWLVPAKFDAARYARSANRSGHLPDDANAYTGFRVVLGEMPATKPLPPVLSAYQKDVKQTTAPKNGPDPMKPYFVDFTKAGKNPAMPMDAWGPIFANHNHFGACCVCPNGDVLAVWYTCVDERGRELAQAASRLRVGSDQWEPASFFFGVPDVNCHAPVLLTHGNRIYHFCTQSLRGWDYASDIIRYSNDNGVTWSKPRTMVTRDDPDALSQPCSAFVTKDGAIVLACDGDLHKDERLIVSRDNGETWKVAKGDLRKSAGKGVIHPAIAPLKDGTIVSFLRGPDPMPMGVSKDLGDTWEIKPTSFPGINGGMKATALRLSSGALLLCSIDAKKLILPDGGTYAALSLDDGKTWAHVRQVDGVGGYMSLAQAPNGVIYLFGSRMGCAAFNEAWLKEGKPHGR